MSGISSRAVRGPDPLRQGHRAAQPPAARLRPEPAVVRARRAGLRIARLDADARPERRGPPVGTQAPAAADLLRRRAARERRPAAAAPPRRTLAMGPGNHRGSRPHPGPRTRITSGKHHHDQEGNPAGPWNPAHPARQPDRNADHGQETAQGTQLQVTQPRSRKMQASPAHTGACHTKHLRSRLLLPEAPLPYYPGAWLPPSVRVQPC